MKFLPCKLKQSHLCHIRLNGSIPFLIFFSNSSSIYCSLTVTFQPELNMTIDFNNTNVCVCWQSSFSSAKSYFKNQIPLSGFRVAPWIVLKKAQNFKIFGYLFFGFILPNVMAFDMLDKVFDFYFKYYGNYFSKMWDRVWSSFSNSQPSAVFLIEIIDDILRFI